MITPNENLEVLEGVNRLLVCRDPVALTCRAATDNGARCNELVFDPLVVGGWRTWHIPGRGEVEAFWGGEAGQSEAQHCILHFFAKGKFTKGKEVPNATGVSWKVFSPDIHADLIYAGPPFIWTEVGLVTPGMISPPVDPPGEVVLRRVIPPPPVGAPLGLTALYRYFDTDDRLLYIGITNSILGRTERHHDKSSWTLFVARSTIEHFPTRRNALDAERAAIESEHPLFNHVHNDTVHARNALVAYLVEKGRVDLLVPAISRG